MDTGIEQSQCLHSSCGACTKFRKQDEGFHHRNDIFSSVNENTIKDSTVRSRQQLQSQTGRFLSDIVR